MSTQIINIERLKGLKLAGMVESYTGQIKTPTSEELGFDDRLSLLIEREVSLRDHRRISRLVRGAGFPMRAAMVDMDYSSDRKLDKRVIQTLANCGWIRSKLNAAVVAPTGLGKTWLACAIGHQACANGLSVQFWRASELYEKIAMAQSSNTLPRLKQALFKVDLMILDDFGMAPMPQHIASVLLDIIDKRDGQGALMVTSQFEPKHWHEVLGQPTVADALLDRIVHNSIIVTMSGESIRKRRGKAAVQMSLEGVR